MTDTELLTKVKEIMLITNTFHDAMLNGYIAEVKDYMKTAGVDSYIVKSQRSVGLIAKGVSDLWTDGKLSEYFKDRLTQLAIGSVCDV